MGRLEEIYRSYKNQVEFFVVYVQEAHPTDGWQSESNITESLLFRQHQNYEEREGVAQTCSLNLHIDIPILIEEIDNSIDEAYGAAPERLYLIGANGKVAYQGGAGPHFFNLDEWQNAIEACLKAKV